MPELSKELSSDIYSEEIKQSYAFSGFILRRKLRFVKYFSSKYIFFVAFFSNTFFYFVIPDMKTLLFYIFFLCTGSIAAHEFWLKAEQGVYVLQFGHLSGSGDGPASLNYEPADFTEMHCLTDGVPKAGRFTVKNGKIAVESECDAVTFRTAKIHYTKTPYGTFRKKKNETEYPLKSWASTEYIKSFIHLTKGLNRPLFPADSSAPEIIPLHSGALFKPEPDSKFTFRIIKNGQGIAGVPVSLNGDVRGHTGADGRINLRLRRCGDQIIQASVSVPGDRISADEVTETATLHFRIHCNHQDPKKEASQ